MPEYKICSYVKRAGRTTASQKYALAELLPKYTLSLNDVWDFTQIFKNNNQVHLEIGFGDGESLVTMAEANPVINFIGIEVHDPGVGHALLQVEKLEPANVRLVHFDAMEVLARNITEASLDRVMLFFPDPWHKKRHHKRRIIRPEFIKALLRVLKPGGVFHMATDWENYAEEAVATLNAVPEFENLSATGDYVPRPQMRIVTKFENRGQQLGHGVWDLMYLKRSKLG